MHYRIRDILQFIRQYDNTGLFKNKSNTVMRKYIRACLEKERFYFTYNNKQLVGITEWYYIKHVDDVIKTIADRKFLNSNPSGTVLWVHNTIFKPGYLTYKVFNHFVRYHKNIKRIIWWRFKYKKFQTHSFSSEGGI